MKFVVPRRGSYGVRETDKTKRMLSISSGDLLTLDIRVCQAKFQICISSIDIVTKLRELTGKYLKKIALCYRRTYVGYSLRSASQDSGI